jgi:adenine deaminase
VPATSVRLVRHRDGTVVAVNTGQPPVVVTLPVATMSSAKPKPQVETRRHTHVQKATNSHG